MPARSASISSEVSDAESAIRPAALEAEFDISTEGIDGCADVDLRPCGRGFPVHRSVEYAD